MEKENKGALFRLTEKEAKYPNSCKYCDLNGLGTCMDETDEVCLEKGNEYMIWSKVGNKKTKQK
jgi:hypothetical protein